VDKEHPMTLDERLALAEQRLKDKRAADQAALDKVYAQQREQARKARTRRRYAVGALADDAGLLAWDDGILSTLFTALATLADVPNPVAVLESVLTDNGTFAAGVRHPTNGTQKHAPAGDAGGAVAAAARNHQDESRNDA
jgi:hypothetical protein